MNTKKYLSVLPLIIMPTLYLPSAVSAAPFLGSAQSFSVLGAAGVTNAHSDPNPQTRIWGDVGTDPAALTAITGFPPAIVTGGSIYGPGGLALAARNDVTTAYGILSRLSGVNQSTPELGGQILIPGVYSFASSAQLTGTLTLDFQGNPNADFVFQIDSTLTTASSSFINVINGGASSGVFWQVGSSATLGSDSVFAGNILALASISLNPRANILCGRAFALTGAVTLIDNTISNDCTAENFETVRADFDSSGFSGMDSTVPEPDSLVLMLLGASQLLRRCGIFALAKH
jgi:hypothetical protein